LAKSKILTSFLLNHNSPYKTTASKATLTPTTETYFPAPKTQNAAILQIGPPSLLTTKEHKGIISEEYQRVTTKL